MGEDYVVVVSLPFLLRLLRQNHRPRLNILNKKKTVIVFFLL